MVEYISGKREVISWVSEAGTYGTCPATGMIPLRNGARLSLTGSKQEFEPIQSVGVDDIGVDYEAGVQDIQLNLRYVPQDWRLFVMAYGKADNVNDTTHYSHSFNYKTAKDLESFSVQRVKNASTDIVDTFRGCKINGFNISWNTAGGGTGKFVECSADILAKDWVESVSESTAETSPNVLAGLQSRQVVVTIDGTAYTACLSGNISFNNKLSDGWYADASATNTRGETEPQERGITGTLVLNYTNDDIFDLWKAGTDVGTQQTTGTATAGSSTTLTDSGSGWSTNAYAGMMVRITGGAGKGQVRMILSNTSEVLTVSRAFSTTPTTTSTFEIVTATSVEFRRTATTDTCKIFFDDFRMTSVPDDTNLDGFNVVTINFVAKDVEVEVTDARTDYYSTA